ncbi:hypothetical protein PoB_000205600 [Plakobranchus ocellatus]|uniref:Uncharacterized protein n=1 Tax=Plakobranchus ocellatus TaxID=259542 RepID=A0AAV3XZS2_9GAST|nr:hypothetical protein PoB_000205600 [Plakobranchus ocellatus]
MSSGLPDRRATKREVLGSNPSPGPVNIPLLPCVHPALNGADSLATVPPTLQEEEDDDDSDARRRRKKKRRGVRKRRGDGRRRRKKKKKLPAPVCKPGHLVFQGSSLFTEPLNTKDAVLLLVN